MEIEKLDTVRDIQELLAIRDDIERIGALGLDGAAPKLDLADLGDAYRLVLEVPGVPQENLEVALQGRTLTVAGIRAPVGPKGESLVSERASGPFERSVDLPSDVAEERVSAHLREGLLILTLPKT